MKLHVTIKAIAVRPSSLIALGIGTNRLYVTCGKDVTFYVDDNARNRATYTIGRELTIAVRPGGAR